jgi:hypothetical protein
MRERRVAEKGQKGGRVGKDVLLEQDRTETSVECTNTLVLQHLAEATDQPICICRLGNETDTGGLKGAESNISEELSAGSGGEVDSSAVVGGRFVSKDVDRLLLEQLITSELERALEEVSSGSGTEAGQQRAGTLLCDHLSESAEEALVVCDGVELNSCLDAVGRWLSVQKFLVLSRQGKGTAFWSQNAAQERLTHRRE